jgi:hypothetical protein
MLYRYKKVVTEHTTHYAEPPRDANGNQDPTWFEHCELDDGYTYVTCNGPVPAQSKVIGWEQVSPPPQSLQKIRERSVHLALAQQRAAKGLHMRADGKIVAGIAKTVADWRKAVVEGFGIGEVAAVVDVVR